MPEKGQSVSAGDLILDDTEVARRMRLLAALQSVLEFNGLRCCLARHHRLVLRYAGGPFGPSGLTNPTLRILTASGTEIVTTDGGEYILGSGRRFACDNPGAAAAVLAEVGGRSASRA